MTSTMPAYIECYDSPPNEFHKRDELFLRLEKYFAETSRADVVLNPATANIISDFHAQVDTAGYTLLFAGTGYEHLLPQSPYFFPITRQRAFWSRLLSSAEAWGFLGFTCGERNICETHWKSLLNVVLPDESLTHFRFYSSTVLLKMARACTAGELSWLLGPYAYILVPQCSPEGWRTGWAVISHPSLAAFSPQAVADRYVVREGVWWQVREEHLAPFKATLAKVFLHNLIEWLWAHEAVYLLAAQKRHGPLEPFLTAVLDEGRNWGLVAETHLSRYARLYIRHETQKDLLHARDNEKDRLRPEAVLQELERRLQKEGV